MLEGKRTGATRIGRPELDIQGECALNKRIFDADCAAAPMRSIPSQSKKAYTAALALLCLHLSGPVQLLSQSKQPKSSPAPAPATAAATAPVLPLLARHYQEGEKIVYTISCINQSRLKTNEYEARAEGVVSKDPSGVFVENFAWTDLDLNAGQVRLSQASRAFREPLSLAPGFKLAIPDLSKVQTGLIGPIADLLTFYADVKIAMNQKGLMRAGDHAYVKFGAPNSWADGTKVVVGQDAIDFSVLLQSIDPATQIATLVVRHVPPEQPQIKLPARWMTTPVSASQNNWVQVEKGSDGKYVAGVGQETFDVEIKVALATGRILSATMDNPVEVMERACNDVALADCGSPERYSIRRQITLHAEPLAAQAAPR
jgi:hypothetical protein